MSDRKVQITADGVTVVATLNDSPTADQVWDALPITGQVQTWGDEIYFSTPVSTNVDDDWAEDTVEMGAFAYWPPGTALCLFFGPTPMSSGDEIRPASTVNVLGTVEGDASVLKSVSSGSSIVVEQA